ncbi:Acetolactate synthase isozyme 2 small subunit [Vibrio stylophorae]|uniref:Acetolactate synthase isozyme 2 small subunit n=1 Tax=Vibrio stylophorae TaxID=659351 RepID=A0ABM8ZPI5_9VIBR|nr:acetolactate synthase 2 small subunit [Vibrio stylophorae]CAH0532211.1 Acetolactate synthase isozyme 2 small subunit [Vibrio stylophorae]
MNEHTLIIQAADRPEMLERILRVTRHRGFHVERFEMAQNKHNTMDIAVTVTSQRPISALYAQIEKLWDVSQVQLQDSQPHSLSA